MYHAHDSICHNTYSMLHKSPSQVVYYSHRYDIMQKCWHEVPEKRPTFTALKMMFAEMLQENSPYIQLDNINTHKAYYKSLHTLEDGSINSGGQSGERLNEDDSAPFLSPSSSSSASTPPESSSFNLLKSNAGTYMYVYVYM